MNILNKCECECDMPSRECEGYFMTEFNFDLFDAQKRVTQSSVYVFRYKQWSQIHRIHLNQIKQILRKLTTN